MGLNTLFVAALGAALLLAPAAWSHEDGMQGAEGMQHGAMKDGAVSGTAKAGHRPKMKKGKKAEHPKKEAKRVKRMHWVCPMHDGGEGDKPGPCPKCGMDMVEEEIEEAPKAAAKPVKHEHHHEKVEVKTEK